MEVYGMRTYVMNLQFGFRWTRLTRMAVSIGAAIAITGMGLPQPVTGPLVNALLLLTVEWGSIGEALLVGMITPMGAALRGILPLPLLVMIPFISLGNAILIGLYGAIRKKNRWVALGAAALAKSLFLYGAATFLILRPLHLETPGNPQVVTIPGAFLTMMSWPQFITAIAGGLLAFGILKVRKTK
jgi:hypothetical protein